MDMHMDRDSDFQFHSKTYWRLKQIVQARPAFATAPSSGRLTDTVKKIPFKAVIKCANKHLKNDNVMSPK